MRYMVSVMGAKQASVDFRRAGDRVLDMRPAFEKVVVLLYRIFNATFDSQGRRGGGSWRMLSEEWLFRKVALGGDRRIGHFTHTLRDAMTERGDDHQNLIIRRQSMSLSTKGIPYAAKQQEERPFVKLTDADRAAMAGIVREHLRGAFSGKRRRA